VLIADDIKLRKVCKALHERGIFATPVTFPAVAKGRSRIRFSVMATHTREELDTLLTAMSELKQTFDLS
jgi:glycine C-acetyltransferase